jgi:hypothetical protein
MVPRWKCLMLLGLTFSSGVHLGVMHRFPAQVMPWTTLSKL